MGQAPVGLLQDHLKHADVERLVERVGAGQLVNPELRGRDGLPGRDLGQVKVELLPVGLLVAQGRVTLHCKTAGLAVTRGSGSGSRLGAGGLGSLGRTDSLENRLVPALPPGCSEGSKSCVLRCLAQPLARGGAAGQRPCLAPKP